ncbi:MAG: Hsp70 family protein [Acidobacteriaceae bacterium]|nr:Hsp70 family protein [Acidobacteriaceae bacterium]
MNMEAGAIGIDIGSQNTVIAVVKNRGVEIVQSESGYVTP